MTPPTAPTAPVSLLLVGAAGRMGRAIARLALVGDPPGLSILAAFDRPDVPGIGTDVAALSGLPPCGVPLSSADGFATFLSSPLPPRTVVVDFSSPDSVRDRLPAIASARVPWVVGTTGIPPVTQALLDGLPSAVLQAANMSLGVNLLRSLVALAASALKDRGFDCEIVERHHRLKKDAPSGTALFLGQAVADSYGWSLPETAVHGRSGLPGPRPGREIGFHAVRGGDILGDHSVLFAASGELLELSHRITSRDTLARGALLAALFLAGKTSGHYSMNDVLGIPSP